MSATNELIKDLSREFITQYYPDEARYFDRLWALMPEKLPRREAFIPEEVERRFWDQLIHSPYATDLVVNIIAGLLVELGLYAGKKLVGLIPDRQRQAQFERECGIRTKNPELVAAVVAFVYANEERLHPCDEDPIPLKKEP